MLDGYFLSKMIYEYRYIICSFTQGRYLYRYYIKPMVKILPESIFFNFLGKVLICSSNYSYINFNFLCTSYSFDLSVLNCTKYLCLGLLTHISNFIKKYSTFIGKFKLAYPLLKGSCK